MRGEDKEKKACNGTTEAPCMCMEKIGGHIFGEYLYRGNDGR